jgi:uncharacterized protein YegP (UPF0339 family)
MPLPIPTRRTSIPSNDDDTYSARTSAGGGRLTRPSSCRRRKAAPVSGGVVGRPGLVASPLSNETNREPAIAGGFEISKDKAGKFRWHLKAANGEIIAASQGYEKKANAEKGIQAVKKAAVDAAVVDLTEEPAKK